MIPHLPPPPRFMHSIALKTNERRKKEIETVNRKRMEQIAKLTPSPLLLNMASAFTNYFKTETTPNTTEKKE